MFAPACAAALRPPTPGLPERSRATASYSARVRVAIDGPSMRARSWTLVAFARPDSLRIEVPGPSGARLIAVAQDGVLTAVFPGERAVYAGPASPEVLEYLLGVGLEPAEVIDLLVGVEPPGLRSYRVGWGAEVPERIRATLRDGAKLELEIEEPRPGVQLPAIAFEPPHHPDYRSVTLAEARELWAAR